MTESLTKLAESYVRSTNAHDSAAFLALFAPKAIVEDNGRTLSGLDAIAVWSRQEIIAARVTLDVLHTQVLQDGVRITTGVDGNFDRTGLPDPLIIEHHLVAVDGRILRLTCRLAAVPGPSCGRLTAA